MTSLDPAKIFFGMSFHEPSKTNQKPMSKQQIAVSTFYEGLPPPWSIAMKELLNDELYLKQVESNDLDA